MKKTKPYTREDPIKYQIIDWLRWNLKKGTYWDNKSVGIWDPTKKVYRKNKGEYSKNGVSDIAGILPGGRALYIEVKSPDNKKRPQDQKDFINDANKSGGLAFFADNLETVIDRIREEGYIK